MPEDTFLGSTAFNAPFTDHQGLLPSSEDESDTSPELGQKLHERITAEYVGNYHLEVRMKEAMNVMRFLKQFPSLKLLVTDRVFKTPECGVLSEWLEPSIITIENDIWANGSLSSEAKMTEKVRQLFKSTARPIKLGPASRFQDVMPQFAGENLRWETLALFLLIAGLCLCSMSSESSTLAFIGNTESAQQELTYRLYETSNACISFCDELGCTNEVYLATLIETGVYTSQVLGDTHHAVWRKLGEVSTAIFGVGLHLPERSKHLPFWLQQIRIRCFGIAYSLDKIVSCFLGRPPRIAKRYCQIELPLDLEWHELAQDEDTLAKAVNYIRVHGWHKKSITGEASIWMWLRPFVMNSLLREDVLEICLGPPQANLKEVALDLIQRNSDTHKSMPHFTDLPPGQWLDQPPSPMKQHIYTDYKYNEFLVRRTLFRHTGEGGDEMLDLAHSILLSVIESHNIRKRTSSSNFETQWSCAFYGLPTAGVLALALLQSTSKTLCYSWVAQNLCAFISILRWLHTPGQGNYKLIDRARRTLQSIVDKHFRILYQNTPLRPTTNANHLNASPSTTDPLFSVGQEAYDFNWLDGNMFDQDFWVNLESDNMLMPG